MDSSSSAAAAAATAAAASAKACTADVLVEWWEQWWCTAPIIEARQIPRGVRDRNNKSTCARAVTRWPGPHCVRCLSIVYYLYLYFFIKNMKDLICAFYYALASRIYKYFAALCLFHLFGRFLVLTNG